MKILAIALLLALNVSTANLSGEWSGSFKAAGADRDVPQVLILKQLGDTFTGTGGPDKAEQYPIEHGKITNDRINFQITTGEWTFTYDLKFSGTEMSGVLTLKSVNESRKAIVVLKKT
jgi:hypothetical protein